MEARHDEPSSVFVGTTNETVNEVDEESVGGESNIVAEPSVGGSSSQRKATSVDVIVNAINNMATSMEQIAAAITRSTEPPIVTNSVQIYEALARLPELKESELLKAMDLLGASQVKFDTFMVLPDRLRVMWLHLQFYGS
ncbi:hypothetical protein KSP39_PZI003588 [Platanthera zijinensis]|uniref:Uncharacterized protein n=1 Tax=Platanthera zijinensis TaxID=2320716 RepID=A0AAP0BVB4_9ASPA